MRVAFLTQYYAPERGAPQTRLRETVAGLLRLGVEATVITCPPHYPGGSILDGSSSWRYRRDVVDGITVHRLPMIPRPNRGILDRVVDQASFAAVATLAAPIVRACDAFVVESPPLFLGATAAFIRAVARRPYVFHVADPWPDFPIAAGVLRGRAPIRAALWLEELAYRGASAITTVTPPLVDRLSRKPGAHGKVHLLGNSVDIDRFHPEMPPEAARFELGWEQAPTFVYSGTVGLAQGLGTLLDAAATIRDLGIRIKIVGDGLEAAELRRRVIGEGLTHVQFLPAIAAKTVPTVLAAADAILVLLRRGPLYEESLPTKLVEGFAAGRPVIVSADGYAADLVIRVGAGFAARAEDAQELAGAIERFAAGNPESRARQGAAARRLAVSRFDRAGAVRELDGVLREIVFGQ